MRQENVEYEHLAFVATMQLLVNYACKREVKNAVGTYCGNKNWQFIGH